VDLGGRAVGLGDGDLVAFLEVVGRDGVGDGLLRVLVCGGGGAAGGPDVVVVVVPSVRCDDVDEPSGCLAVVAE
jgi:hypothetical protein